MDLEQISNLIKQRRSVRHFKSKKVEREKLERMIELATWAPSGSNAQAWNFIVLDEEDMLKRLTAFLPGVSQPPAAMICLCVDYEREYKRAGKLGEKVLGIMDISMAAQNIMLAATTLQLGSCAIRGFNEDVVKMALNLPEHVRPELIVIVGYPLSPARVPARRPIEEVLHWQKHNDKGEAQDD